MKKRFLLFAGEDYYPFGGGNDFKGSFDSVKEAIEFFDTNKRMADWANVFDTEKESVVTHFGETQWNEGQFAFTSTF